MIGEFHNRAIDRGSPATGITGVLSQEDRVKAYRTNVEGGVRTELVRMYYFQRIEQPVYGRFDGENYNLGVVNMNCRTPNLMKP